MALILPRVVRLRSCAVLIRRSLCGGVARYCSSTQHSEDMEYDVVIAGGGMVGAAQALALAAAPELRGCKVALLEAGKPAMAPPLSPRDMPGEYSNRVVAINPGSVALLDRIGAWQHVLASTRYCPVRRLMVWDAATDSSYITFDGEPSDNGEVAVIVENNVLLHSIYKELDALTSGRGCDPSAGGASVDVLYECRVKRCKLPSVSESSVERASITLNDEPSSDPHQELQSRRISSKLVIGAEGIHSTVRDAMPGNHWAHSPYDQTALVAIVHFAEEVSNNMAWQRFLSTGPVAMLPLTKQQSCIIWSTRPHHAKHLLTLSDEEFVDSLNAAWWSDEGLSGEGVEQVLQSVGHYLPLVSSRTGGWQYPPSIVRVQSGSRAAFPLGIGHSTCYVSHRCALIGDAAHRVHPMAGLGVNLGFADVASLSKHLCEGVYDGSDVGSLQDLLRYESERQARVVPTMLGIDALYRLYSNNIAPLVLIRALGLNAVQNWHWIKQQIIQQAKV